MLDRTLLHHYYKTGKVPKILRAIRFEAIGVQKGLKPVELGAGPINPSRDDFFRKVIEERKGKKKSDSMYYFLKILANAGCYGLYAEVNGHQTGKNDAKQVGIFSGEANILERATIMEQPGLFYFPPVSALITSGGRLLLSILERMVADAGGTYQQRLQNISLKALQKETGLSRNTVLRARRGQPIHLATYIRLNKALAVALAS